MNRQICPYKSFTLLPHALTSPRIKLTEIDLVFMTNSKSKSQKVQWRIP